MKCPVVIANIEYIEETGRTLDRRRASQNTETVLQTFQQPTAAFISE